MRKPLFTWLGSTKLFQKWPKSEIYDNDGDDKLLYMRRYYLIPRGEREDDRAWWPFSIKLHKIARSDWDRALHDHPWPAFSILLSGSYEEVRFLGNVPGGKKVRRVYRPGNLNIIHAADYHRLVLDKPVWSLFVTGKKKQEWGFFDEDKQLKVPYDEYEYVGART